MAEPNGDFRADEFDGRPELVRKRARVIFFKNFAFGALITWMILVSIFLVYNGVVGIQSRSVLLDCTRPNKNPSSCYVRGQERTADLITQLIDNSNAGDAKTQVIVYWSLVCINSDAVPAEGTQNEQYRALVKCVNGNISINE